MRPSLLILDEPFSALDPKHAQMIDEILSQLAREGITVVIATHNAAQAYRWADRVVILHNGRIQAQGTPEEIFCDQALLQRTSLVPPEILAISRALQQKEAVAGRKFSQNGRIPLLDAALLINIPFRVSFFFLALVIFGHYSYNNRYKEAHPKTNQAGGMDR